MDWCIQETARRLINVWSQWIAAGRSAKFENCYELEMVNGCSDFKFHLISLFSFHP